jgi:hypothetical protein
MTRRVFIGLSFTALAALAAGSLQWLNTKKMFHAYIKNLWPWLKIDPKAIDQFIHDYYEYEGYAKYEGKRLTGQNKLFLILIFETIPLFHNIWKEIRTEFREKLASQFLLSTDFFQNGMNENRMVKYVLYYDPYINFCYNAKP